MHIIRNTFWMTVGAGVGYAAAWLMDDREGARRRNQLADQTKSAVRDATDRAQGAAKARSNEAMGKAREAAPEVGQPSDDVLKARIQSEVLGHLSIPDQDLVIEVVAGDVTIRGQVPNPQGRQELLDGVRGVHGVGGVNDLTHLPDEPAPNKEPLREVSHSKPTPGNPPD